MSARDELTKLIVNRDEFDGAEAILDAGWRPPALVDPGSDRCPTCGCELAYPTAIHLLDCGEGESAGTPSSAILRYEIRIDDTAQSLPAGEIVLVHAHRQGLRNRLEVWIQVAEGELRTQTLRVFGTGQPIPAEWRPLGSCVAGPFVWHVCGGE